MTTEEADPWAVAHADVDRIAAERRSEYVDQTIVNARDFLTFLKQEGIAVPKLGAGYWPTIRMWWDCAELSNLEIEVFDIKLEVYRFFDGKTDIWYEEHLPGQVFSSRLKSELSSKG